MKKFVLILVAFFALFTASARAFASSSATEPPVMQVADIEASVKVTHGGFEVHNPGSQPVSVEVYALTGRCVLAEVAPSGVTSFSLPAGHYIVRLGDRKSAKIVVK